MPAPSTTESRRTTRHHLAFWLVAAVALAVTSVLHFCRIESAPPGFFGDECSHAYNAYCIALTGADEYGVKYPVFFRGFGEFKDPVMIYSLVPFIKTLGLQRWVARLPSGLYLIAAAVAFGFLVQESCASRWLSLAAGFGFTLLPWVFPGSRAVTPYTPMLCGMLGGWLLLVMALRRDSFGYAVAAGVAWAFAMYSYSAGRPMTVLILTCFGVAYFGVLRTRWKTALAFVVTWIAMLIPLALSLARTPQALTTRFGMISIFQDQPAWNVALTRFASRYAEYFGLQFLFFKGDQNVRQHSGYGGELFLFLAPLILAGIYCLVRRWRSQPACRFVALGLLVYPVAAALTVDHMHSGRSINGVIFWAFTAVIGAHCLWENRGAGRNVLILACCAGIVEIGLYMKDYFGVYPGRCRQAFSASFTETLERSFQNLDDSETLYISDSAFAPLRFIVDEEFKPWFYVTILFFGKIDPRVYQQIGIPKDKVCLYEGVIHKPGLLLRCDSSLDGQPAPDRPPVYIRNVEPIPPGAMLLGTRSVSLMVPLGLRVQYELYRVR
jgi:hypothetical protein